LGMVITDELGVAEVWTSTSLAVPVLGVTAKLVSTSTVDEARVGAVNAKLAISPAANARKNDRFIMQISVKGMSLEADRSNFLRLLPLDADRSRCRAT